MGNQMAQGATFEMMAFFTSCNSSLVKSFLYLYYLSSTTSSTFYGSELEKQEATLEKRISSHQN